jgi:chromosome segregation ATPase
MSKLAILKELTDIKAIAQRKSTLSRWALALAAAYLLFGYGQEGLSYLSTASRMVGEKVRSNVPLEFELERARTMIGGLIPDVRQNMMVIAQEEVGVDNLHHELDRSEGELGKQREELVHLRGELSGNEEQIRLGNRTASREEVKEELTRRFAHFQVAEATVASHKQLLAAREKSLDAARAKLKHMLTAKRDLELQVANLQARLKTKQSQTLAGSIEVNDSQVSRCQGLLNDVRVRLEVADRLFTSNGDLTTITADAISTSEDIGEQIDRHFGQSNKDVALTVVR